MKNEEFYQLNRHLYNRISNREDPSMNNLYFKSRSYRERYALIRSFLNKSDGLFLVLEFMISEKWNKPNQRLVLEAWKNKVGEV